MKGFSGRQLDVLIAGVQKAGTTSMLGYLKHHPSLVGHEWDESSYFVDDRIYEAGWDEHRRRLYRGKSVGENQLLFAKSSGVTFIPGALDRAKQHNPSIRLIVMLREPGARAYSAYRYLLGSRLERSTTFGEALRLEDVRLATDFGENHHFAYKRRGLYAPQLEEAYERFGRDQVRVVVLEEFQADPVRAMGELIDWLGLVPWSSARVEEILSNRRLPYSMQLPVTGLGRVPSSLGRLVVPPRWRPLVRSAVTRQPATKPGPFEPESRELLTRRFEEPNQALYRLLGRTITAWEQPGTGAD